MNGIAKLFTEQWIYMLVAVVLVAATFFVKKKFPQKFKAFCIGGLAVTSVLLILLALIFQQPDLFLLVPIFFFCCELFGYEITGKIVAVFFVDYICICLLNLAIINGWINEVFNTLIFFILQVAAAVCAGLIMDRHLRMLKKSRKEQSEEEQKVQSEDEALDSHVEDVFNRITDNDAFMEKYKDTQQHPKDDI
ncbi:MAG: hypothetical protein U0M23_10125 [Acutalibacteraceae bacterium]|nr:hypothetical protein [Acutalibacteraceae bacterium]HIR02483.1 hypothetical protein [Candidatus Scatovicinus merdipullorum]